MQFEICSVYFTNTQFSCEISCLYMMVIYDRLQFYFHITHNILGFICLCCLIYRRCAFTSKLTEIAQYNSPSIKSYLPCYTRIINYTEEGKIYSLKKKSEKKKKSWNQNYLENIRTFGIPNPKKKR